jgi:hypothetical protein
VLLGRVVFQVDAGQPLLSGREDFVLVLQVVLARLKEDAVEVQLAHLLGRHLMDVVGPRVAGGASEVAVGPAGLDRQVELLAGMGQVVEIAPVDVPGQDAQGTHRHVFSCPNP